MCKIRGSSIKYVLFDQVLILIIFVSVIGWLFDLVDCCVYSHDFWTASLSYIFYSYCIEYICSRQDTINKGIRTHTLPASIWNDKNNLWCLSVYLHCSGSVTTHNSYSRNSCHTQRIQYHIGVTFIIGLRRCRLI